VLYIYSNSNVFQRSGGCRQPTAALSVARPLASLIFSARDFVLAVGEQETTQEQTTSILTEKGDY